MTTEHAYALIKGHTTEGNLAIRTYEVTDLDSRAVLNVYYFTVVKPLFGAYVALSIGRTLQTPKKYVVKTIEDLKDLTKELVIKSAFKNERFHDLKQLVSQMNKV